MTLDERRRSAFAPAVGALAQVVRLLADEPREDEVRRRAADVARHILRNPPDTATPEATAVRQNVRMAVRDFAAFAAAEPDPPRSPHPVPLAEKVTQTVTGELRDAALPRRALALRRCPASGVVAVSPADEDVVTG
ncbi:hypothetical protein B9W68_00865 [Streptomyces sp. CS227]|uniref:hypothetical protein n=1 Tax=Streptomyces sp. CS227 TaxID=1982763 RepID=UPI000B40BE18|nr:hypothetical protein [Streptomyces sp. CS227]OWA19099.1 hypothetical protein B9W68_00865 [Streptomyces sp. CS227]